MLSVEEESMVIMSHVDLVSVLRISRAAGSLGNVQFQWRNAGHTFHHIHHIELGIEDIGVPEETAFHHVYRTELGIGSIEVLEENVNLILPKKESYTLIFFLQ